MSVAEPKEAAENTEATQAATSVHSETLQEPRDAEKEMDDRAEKAEGSASDGASKAEPPIEFPSTAQTVVIMSCLLSAVFLMSLDRTIISTAIPRITDEFNSLDDVGWYGSAFMLTTTCFQLLWGKVYAFYPPKYLFLALIGLFEVGSAICGAAPNSIALIFGRAIAGMGSAGILTGTFVILAKTVPLAKRPFWGGFFEVVLGLSSVLGPLLGGAFTSNVSWRWCFYINLPIGGTAMVVIFFLLKTTPPEKPGLTPKEILAELDLLGEFFLFPGLICLLLALQWGGGRYAWGDWRTILLLVIFGLCVVGFILTQIFFQKSATIQAHVIKNRSIVSAMSFMFCLASVMMTFIYYLPIWLQAIKNKSAVTSGIDTLPFVGGLTLASVLAAQFTLRTGYYTPMAILSSILMPIGGGLISTFQVDTSTGTWVGYQILLGLGIGAGLQQGPQAAFTVVEPKDVPIAVALIFFCQQLAGAIFVSVGQNVLTSKFIHNLRVGDAGALDPRQILDAGALNLRYAVSAADLPGVLKAYNDALSWVYTVGVITACLSAIGSFTLEWRSVKKYQGPTRKVKKEAESDEKSA